VTASSEPKTPSQELLVIRRNHKTGVVSLDALRWGLIPNWCSDGRTRGVSQNWMRDPKKEAALPLYKERGSQVLPTQRHDDANRPLL
jgi:putative SOS response-associated peptidase YedK